MAKITCYKCGKVLLESWAIEEGESVCPDCARIMRNWKVISYENNEVKIRHDNCGYEGWIDVEDMQALHPCPICGEIGMIWRDKDWLPEI